MIILKMTMKGAKTMSLTLSGISIPCVEHIQFIRHNFLVITTGLLDLMVFLEFLNT